MTCGLFSAFSFNKAEITAIRIARSLGRSSKYPLAEAPSNRPLASNHSLYGLAINYEDLISKGRVQYYAEIATLGHFTRMRVKQIMNLRLLAPDIQETLSSLERKLICLDNVQFVLV